MLDISDLGLAHKGTFQKNQQSPPPTRHEVGRQGKRSHFVKKKAKFVNQYSSSSSPHVGRVRRHFGLFLSVQPNQVSSRESLMELESIIRRERLL